jgi:8-oxo-dGTP pyrophosphatase MutT (NUDIX family)
VYQFWFAKVGNYNDAAFPPYGDWDMRLSNIGCRELSPVEMLHENPWFVLRNRGGYFTTEYHLPQVAVLPVINGDSVVMVRVNRPVINDMTLELPAGGFEKDEDPVRAAARELGEESGIIITDMSRFVPMPPIAISSTRVPNLSYVFKIDVSEHEFAKRRPHDDEIHSVERFPIKDLAGLMSSGQIYVSLSLAVLGIFLVSGRR